jgi:predicted dehydrogenase
MRKLERKLNEALERERVAIASWDEERHRALRESKRVLDVKADADALAEAVKIMRVGICSAAMPNATEREIASDAVKQASELLKTYRNKYPQ